MKPWILILAAVLGFFYWHANSGMAAGDPRHQTGASGVVMLSAEWCGYCSRLRQDLDRSGVHWRELDIERDPEGEAAFRAIGRRGVPVTVVGQDIVYGYDPGRIRALMQAAGHSLASSR